MAYVWDDYLGDFTWSDDADSGETWEGYYDDYTGEFFMPNYSEEFGVQEVMPQEGQDFGGWRYFSDGTAISPQGTYYNQGERIFGADSWWNKASDAVKGALMRTFKKPESEGGGVDWAKIAGIGGGIAGLMGLGKSEQRPSGYQGGIPKYTAVRERVQDTYDPNRRPGSSGQRYFSDIKYVPDADVATAQAAVAEQAAGLAALNAANPARQVIPVQQPPSTTTPTPEPTAAPRAAAKVIEDLPVPTQTLATGGIAALKQGKYLRGNTDGMTDELRTTIEGEQPAALSHGEFVVPADVVSHLGNGNSEAGAKKLYEMMDKIRQARTGTKKQGKQINPNKYLPV